MKIITVKIPKHLKSVPDQDFLEAEDMALVFQVRCSRTLNNAVANGHIPKPTDKMCMGSRYPKHLWRMRFVRSLVGKQYNVPGKVRK